MFYPSKHKQLQEKLQQVTSSAILSPLSEKQKSRLIHEFLNKLVHWVIQSTSLISPLSSSVLTIYHKSTILLRA